VAAGQAVYGPSVAQRIVGFYTGVQERYTAQVFPQLTTREREVLDLVAAGVGNHAVAARLHLLEKTVRNHVSALLVKIGVPHRAALVVAAREGGLGQAQSSDRTRSGGSPVIS
jgi:DNA-binding NarL/FixJ family response regulator